MDCAKFAKKALRMIESKPGSYRVVANGHPGGLCGNLFAGRAHR
jgi:hypothetical protein